MNRSLSVFLPLHNAQKTLEAVVASLLEVVAELTPRFDVLLIDDASTDDTVHLADELARAYPQVRVVAHSRRQGRAGVLRSGLSHSQGDLVLLRDEACDLGPHELVKLWRPIEDYDAVLGHAAPLARRGPFGGLAAATGTAGTLATLLLLRRHVAQRVRLTSIRVEDLRAELSRFNSRWCEVELRGAAAPAGPPSLTGPHARTPARRRWTAALAAKTSAGAAAPHRGPKYLQRVRAFALGE